MANEPRRIGSVLREARERRGLTQEYVSHFLGVGRTQLVTPSIATVEEVADALGVSLVYTPRRGWAGRRDV